MKAKIDTSALDLIEESLAILRQKGLSLLPLYGIGTIPFVVVFLFFWSDMARDSLAEERLPRYALGLASLYFWMKFWQTAFVRKLRYSILDQEPPPQTWKQKGWTLLFQGAIQPTQWITLPLAKLMMIPFGYFHAFYETLHAVGDGENLSVRETISKTWKNALLLPKQNHLLVWMMSPWMMIFAFAFTFLAITLFPIIRPELKDAGMEVIQSIWIYLLACCIPFSPFGVLIFANIALIVFGTPFLLHTLLGMESTWTMGSFGITDPFFLAVSLSLTYLVMDPILKTAYTLRDFYGRSQVTAEDLLLQIKKRGEISRLLSLVILGIMIFSAPLRAETPPSQNSDSSSVDSSRFHEETQRFEKTLQKISQQREYTWRQERRPPTANPDKEPSMFARLWNSLKSISDGLGSLILDLIRALFGGDKESEGGTTEKANASALTQYAMKIGLVLLAILVCGGLFLYFRKRNALPPASTATPVEMPDLESIHTQATDLPVGEWEKLALSLMEKGDWRLAARAWYLAGLALLHEQGVLRIRRGKSNADYLQETKLQFRQQPSAYTSFESSTFLFEKIWYGFDISHLQDSQNLQQWVLSLRGGRS